MKKIMLLLVLCQLLCAVSRAEDLRQIVAAQIEQAKSGQSTHNSSQKSVQRLPVQNASWSKQLAPAIFLVSSVMLCAFFYFGYSRFRRKKGEDSECAILKENIRKLRQENIGHIEYPELSKVRVNLREQSIRVDDYGRTISRQAKRMRIAKGELHLAAKINMLSTRKKCSSLL